MDIALTGRKALVTGANSGIGKSIALACGKAGADVAINYITHPEAADEVKDEIEKMGRKAITVCADISKESDVESMVGQVITTFGKLDILVNNAGLQILKSFVDLTPEEWDKMLSVDLRGTFLVTLYAVREMIKSGGGKIVNITSVHQYMPKPGFAPYCVAKAGEGMLTKVLGAELAPHKINVNAIAPGAVDTPMNEKFLHDPALCKKLLNEIPWGRVASPDEVANLAVFLASEAADYITGATYVIDGGLSVLGAKY